MDKYTTYCSEFEKVALKNGLSKEHIETCLSYAKVLQEQGLPVIYDQPHLAQLLGLDYYYVLALSNETEKYYKEFKIPKKRGEMRTIEEPYPDLKEIQTWILRNILEQGTKGYVSLVAKAFIKGKSLRENARFHKNNKVVVALDIHHYFDSIKAVWVYALFVRMGYTPQVANLLTKLCTLNDALPQGAPTSPMLSNMIMQSIDNCIWCYCKNRHINYTRYADDLTFSGEKIHVGHLTGYVAQRLKPLNLHLNKEKTKVMRKGCRQVVIGAVVNEKIQVQRTYRDQIRQEMYYVIKYGCESHMRNCKNKPEWIKTADQYRQYLMGKINYVLQINPKDSIFIQYANWLKQIRL